MKPTEDLIREHVAINLMLDILEKACNRLEAGDVVDPGHQAEILEFLGGFVDRCHNGKEEKSLFPALLAAGIRGEGGPIGTLLKEHQTGREYAASMNEAIGKSIEGDREALAVFLKNARAYVSLFRLHSHKEDYGMFPTADRVLTAEKQDAIQEDFKRIEIEDVGAGRLAEFYNLLDRLRAIYLV